MCCFSAKRTLLMSKTGCLGGTVQHYNSAIQFNEGHVLSQESEQSCVLLCLGVSIVSLFLRFSGSILERVCFVFHFINVPWSNFRFPRNCIYIPLKFLSSKYQFFCCRHLFIILLATVRCKYNSHLTKIYLLQSISNCKF